VCSIEITFLLISPHTRTQRHHTNNLVQASNSVAESRWLLELADANSFIAGVVGWVDLTSPEIELSTHPKFKGVRHLVESEPDDDWLLQPAVLSNLQKLSVHGLSYDLLVHTRHLKHVPVVVETCPELAFVIDHLAKPRSTGRDQRMVAGIQTARTLSKHYLQTIGPGD
jgi:L-fuconolactonase